MPNHHRSAPSHIKHYGATWNCHTDNHKQCTHALNSGEHATLEKEALLYQTATINIKCHLVDDVKCCTCTAPIVLHHTKKHCFKCGHHGHIHQLLGQLRFLQEAYGMHLG